MANKIPRRAAGAASAAAAVTRTIYKGSNNKAEIQGIAFRLVLLSALTISLVMVGAIVAWALVEGGSRVNIGLFTNNPSSFRPETAGYRPGTGIRPGGGQCLCGGGADRRHPCGAGTLFSTLPQSVRRHPRAESPGPAAAAQHHDRLFAGSRCRAAF